jgi:hypothetical protein
VPQAITIVLAPTAAAHFLFIHIDNTRDVSNKGQFQGQADGQWI